MQSKLVQLVDRFVVAAIVQLQVWAEQPERSFATKDASFSDLQEPYAALCCNEYMLVLRHFLDLLLLVIGCTILWMSLVGQQIT